MAIKNNLNDHSRFYTSEAGTLNKEINVSSIVELIKIKNLVGGKAMQLGLGDGFMAEQLADYYDTLTVIEGSDEVLQKNFNKKSGYEIVCSLFESYSPEEKFDYILGNHVLEHVDDPVLVLRHVRKWLKPGGKALFTVPNATSLHRRIGVEMGLLKVLHGFSEQDMVVGHKRVYNVYQFVEDIRSAGYEIIEIGGYGVKLVSNLQMKTWSKELLQSIFKISISLPVEICSDISVICKSR